MSSLLRYWIYSILVAKYFPGHGTFEGTIVRYDETYYKVRYEDGDEEDLSEDEIEKIVV